MSISNRIKKIAGSKLAQNAVLNTIAAAIPVVLLQLAILPLLGRKTDADKYGLIVTLLSVLNVVPVTFGNALNNIRLLHNHKYEEKGLKGDFALILLFELILNVIIIFIITSIYVFTIFSDGEAGIHIFLVIAISVLWLLREYYIVAFLINLDYKKILINNCLLALGYIVGSIILHCVGIWELWEIIYITGYLFSIVFIMKATNIWKEKLAKTNMLNFIIKEDSVYIISCLLYRLISFADKMLLYPLIGGALVSIYYVATLSGKVVNMLITPLSGVMLSHLSKYEITTDTSFKKILRYGTLVSLAGYIICVCISRPILRILYPQYVSEAMKYVLITTATICVGVLISLLNPFILKKNTMKWQAIINGATLTFYVILSLVLLKLFSLTGFCIGSLLANVFKLIIMIWLFLKYDRRELTK